MPPQPRRGILLVLLALLLVPASLATHDPTNPLDAHGGVPDLVASTADVGPVDERAAPRLCGTVFNVGSNSLVTTPFYVELRVDGSATNATLVTDRVGSGGGVSLCWTLGATLQRGLHRFTVVADSEGEVPESNETNNAARDRWFSVAPAPQADLRVKSFQAYPRVAKPNQYQLFTLEVLNAGQAPSVEAQIEIRDENGVIAVETVPALAPQRSAPLTVFTNPETRPVGNFTAVATVDALDAVDEMDEANNVAYFTYEIPGRPLPDLVVRSAEVNGTLVARRGLRMDVVLANVGPRVAQLPVVRLMEGNVSLGNATRQSLGAGANATFQFHFVLPSGNHTLRVVADPDGSVIEANETNNLLLVDVAIQPGATDAASPNLLVRSLGAAPNDPSPGEAVLLTALVANAGDAASNMTSLAFYADGKLLGRKPVPPLRADSYATVAFSWGTSTPGDHDLRAQVDPDNGVAEADERDNEMTVYVSLIDPTPRPPPAAPEGPETPPNGTTPPPATPQPPEDAPPAGETPAPEAPQVVIGELSIRTAQVPGGLKGVMVVALRNPTLEPIGRMSVTYSVDGKVVKEVLVNGLAAAASAPATSGEVDLPEGRHTVRAEVRILGSAAPAASVENAYEAAAGERGVPSPGPLAVLAAAALLGVLRRRRR